MSLKLTCILLFVVGLAYGEIKMDKYMGRCGDTVQVMAGDESIVTASGNAGAECVVKVKGQVKDNCEGVCIDFKASDFTDCNVTLTVSGAPSENMVYSCNQAPPMKPWCTLENVMTLTLNEASAYNPAPTPGYSFRAEVYNKCGDKYVDSPTFEEAAKALEGFHHGEEFENNERTTFITGICLGFGLASIFLVILLIAWCYVKNNPNRGDSKLKDEDVAEKAKQPQKQLVTKF